MVGVAALVIPGVGPMITGTLGGIFAGGSGALLAGGAAAAAAHGIAATITAGLMMAGSPIGDMVPMGSEAPLTTFRTSQPVGWHNQVVDAMLPIRRWWHFPRFKFAQMTGDCMSPHCGNGRHLLIDRPVYIRAGDLIAIRTNAGLICKRFVRFDRDGLVVETTKPLTQRYYIPLEALKWVYRVRAHGATRRDLITAARSIMASEDAHNELLGYIIPPADRELV